MRNWIFAAVIGLATCGQAWAWDDEEDSHHDDYQYHNGQNRYSQDLQRQFDRNYREALEIQNQFNQQRSVDLQEESLKIQKRRLEIEEDRERDRRLGY